MLHETPHLLTVAEYMSLEIEERTELLAGIIYDMSPRGDAHRYAVNTLTEILQPAFAGRFVIQVQDAVAIPNWGGKNAPEPDVAIIEPRSKARPEAASTRTVIEVANRHSYARDRWKMRLYVDAGIPAWIVNLAQRRVEYYDRETLALPAGREFQLDDIVAVLDEVRIAVKTLFADAVD